MFIMQYIYSLLHVIYVYYSFSYIIEYLFFYLHIQDNLIDRQKFSQLLKNKTGLLCTFQRRSLFDLTTKRAEIIEYSSIDEILQILK